MVNFIAFQIKRAIKWKKEKVLNPHGVWGTAVEVNGVIFQKNDFFRIFLFYVLS